MAHRTFRSRWSFLCRNNFFGLTRETPEVLLRCFQFLQSPHKNPTGTFGAGCRFTSVLQKQIVFTFFSASSAPYFRNVFFSRLATSGRTKNDTSTPNLFPSLSKSNRIESTSNFLLSGSWTKRISLSKKKEPADIKDAVSNRKKAFLLLLSKDPSLKQACLKPPGQKKTWGGFRFFLGGADVFYFPASFQGRRQ